jgi:hypothetical protein
MRWTILLAAACTGGSSRTKGTGETAATGETGDSGPVATGDCVYDLDLWCFNRENPPGPSQTTGTCPAVTIDGLMTGGATGYFAPTHLGCTDPTHGALDVVNVPTGYGGPFYWFDDTGALVAFTWTTDYPLCDRPGSDGASHYGFVPDCADWCEVEDPNDWYSYPTCP